MREWIDLLCEMAGPRFGGELYPEEDPHGPDEQMAVTGTRLKGRFRYYDNNDINFRVMDHDHDKHQAERPLAVVIHPGDMIVHAWGLQGMPEEDKKLFFKSMRWANENMLGMAKELRELRRKGYDFAVLHRESSVQFPEARDNQVAVKKVWLELSKDHGRGSMMFGDSLDKAAQWMINNLHIADRPHIYMLGAYSDPQFGCLTSVGKAFAKVLDPSKITVSPFSPVSDDPDEQHTMWKP